MASQRKLQSEIDRTLKKIHEGIDVFNDIWNKVYTATQQSQKEKHESDLKKEIKKLQRFREQLKVWLSNNDVKDKYPLMELRKTIEQKMEDFKVCERETKTKAYSKEGLAQGEKIDPILKAKCETREWVGDSINQLNAQIETFDCHLERLNALGGSKSKQKHNKAEIEYLLKTIKRHQFHILKLEQVMRLLDNDALDYEAVDNLKDDIEYYIDKYQDTNGYNDNMQEEDVYMDDIYESLDMDTILNNTTFTIDPLPGSGTASIIAGSMENTPTMTGNGTNEVAEEMITSPGSKGILNKRDMKKAAKLMKEPTSKSHTPSNASYLRVVKDKSPALTSVTPSKGRTKGLSYTAAVASTVPRGTKTEDTKPTNTVVTDPPTAWKSPNPRPLLPTPTAAGTTSGGAPAAEKPAVIPWKTPATFTASNSTSSWKQPSSATTSNTSDESSKTPPSSSASPAPSSTNVEKKQQQSNEPKRSSTSEETTQENRSTPNITSQAATPAAASTPADVKSSLDTSFLGDEYQQALLLLDASYNFSPDAIDSARKPSANYVPRNPFDVPSSFPTSPVLPLNSSFYEKLDCDTLFFVFYYQQGTYQQYLAAKELKRQTWAYHKKYMTWFKRHEEPKITTDEYEQGTYVYFDYESGWCQRTKTDFTFEYNYLEDELLPS